MDMSTKAIMLTVFVLAFTAVAAVVDWRTQKLPNWLTVPCFVSALLFHFVAGFFLVDEPSRNTPLASDAQAVQTEMTVDEAGTRVPPANNATASPTETPVVEVAKLSPLANAFLQLGWSLVGFVTGFSILFVMWLVGWGGGGDAKMMGALGAWLMPQAILYVFILTAVLTVVWYGKLIVTGEQARLRKALSKAKRRGQEESVKPHHAPYAFRAGLAVWLVLAYFMVVHQATYPFLSS